MIPVTGNDGRLYDLDNPNSIDWTQVSQNSEIAITVKINSAFVYGHSVDVETILHELVVDATKYANYIKGMRAMQNKRSIPTLWENASNSSNSGLWQNNRLGHDRDRALTKDIESVGKAMNDSELKQALSNEYHDDVSNH